MYMAIYNKYDGNITYIPISSVEQRDLSNKPVEDRFLKYIITNQKNATLNDFRFMHGEKIFEPIVDNNTIEMHFSKDQRLDDFLEFIKNTVYVAKHAVHKNDMAILNKIANYMYTKFNIIL